MNKLIRFIQILFISVLVWRLLISYSIPDTKILYNSISSDSTRLISLGRYLFYDNRLSYNFTKSCASCHDQRFAFTDGYRKSIGIYGDNVRHNSLPLFNLESNLSFNWNEPQINKIEDQIVIPLFNDTPHELGLKNHEKEIVQRLVADSLYLELFKAAFPSENNPINFKNIISSLGSFCLSIKSYNSDYDRDILSPSAKRGKELFNSKKYNCINCHSGPNFNQTIGAVKAEENFHNYGIYYLDANKRYTDSDNGLNEKTSLPKDIGKFRVPTLRNLRFTAPYFHNGSTANLLEVLNIYEKANRYSNFDTGIISDSTSNSISAKYTESWMPMKDKQDLISFLMSLNDTSLVSDIRYQNPFKY